jgi:hypothetical protein
VLSSNQLLNRRYRIVEKCGKGGMGTVYRAEDERLALTVAIKECAFDRPDLRRLFTQEARLVARLRHRTIARVIDHFEEGDCQYLVMDFVPGDTLADIPPSGLTLDRIYAWGEALLEALAFLHGHEPPIVHRDIKPHNIKLWPDDTPVLLDFGLAKGGAPASHTIPSRSVVGYTPHYAALEQMQGSGTDARSDLYSFSATMYRLLTGTVPPDAMTRVEATNDGRPDPLRPVVTIAPHVPAPLAAIVEKGMATAKSARFASAEDMRRAWSTCRAAQRAATFVHSTVTLPAPAPSDDPGEAVTIRPAPAAPLPVVPVTPAPAPTPARPPGTPARQPEAPVRKPEAPARQPETPARQPEAPARPALVAQPAPAPRVAGSSSTAPTPASIIAGVLFVGLIVGGLVFGVPAWEAGRPRPGATPPPAAQGSGPEPNEAGGGSVPNDRTPPTGGAVPNPAVQVLAWEAQPADIVAGESTTLRWRVKDAADLEITPEIGAIDPRGGSLTVAPTKTTTYRLRSPSQPSLSPMAITVAVAEPLETLAGFVRQWELMDATPVGADWLALALELKGTQHHLGQVVAVPMRAMTARPRVLATWRNDLFGGMVGSPDGRVITAGRIYATADGRPLGAFEGSVSDLVFSGDGKIAFASRRADVDGRSVPAVEARDGRTGRGLWQTALEGPVIDIAVSPEGTRVGAAFGDGNQRRVAILDAATGKRLRVLELWPSAIAWTDPTTLAVAEPGRGVVFANTETGQASARMPMAGPLTISPDGRWLAAKNASGPVVLTPLRPGQSRPLPIRAAQLAFTSDSRLLVAWSPTAVEVYSVPDGTRVGSLP